MSFVPFRYCGVITCCGHLLDFVSFVSFRYCGVIACCGHLFNFVSFVPFRYCGVITCCPHLLNFVSFVPVRHCGVPQPSTHDLWREQIGQEREGLILVVRGVITNIDWLVNDRCPVEYLPESLKPGRCQPSEYSWHGCVTLLRLKLSEWNKPLPLIY